MKPMLLKGKLRFESLKGLGRVNGDPGMKPRQAGSVGSLGRTCDGRGSLAEWLLTQHLPGEGRGGRREEGGRVPPDQSYTSC